MLTAEVEMISEEAARRELWVSFCSLIRAYVAGAQVGLEPVEALVVQQSESELEIVGSRRVVRLHFDARRAEGHWVIHQAPAASDDTLLAEGAFRIGMDSKVEWTGLPGKQELDVIAEAVATMLTE